MKKIIMMILIIGVILLGMTGCGTTDSTNDDTNGNGGTDDPVNGDKDNSQDDQVDLSKLLNQLVMDVNVNAEEQGVDFEFSLTNNHTEPIELGFASGQQFEIVVKDMVTNEEVYRYSEGKAFTEAFVYEELAAGDTETWVDQWDYQHDDNRVNAGNYQAEITLLTKQLNKQVIEAKPFSEIVEFKVPEAEKNTAFRNVKVDGENGNYTVSGEARVFEGVFFYNIEDGHTVIVKETKVTVNEGAPNWSPFEITVNLSQDELPVNGALTLNMYERSAKDNKAINNKFVQLDQFKTE